MVRQLIRQVRVIDPLSATDRVASVRVVDGAIEAIGDRLPVDGAEVIEAKGQVLLPGLVDLHSHSGEPGYESRETLHQLLQAARAGGVTRLAILPSTHPPADSLAVVTEILGRYHHLAAGDTCLPQLHLWAALTRAEAEQMSELGELASAQVAGFASPEPIANSLLRQRLLEYLRPLGKPVMLWACDRTLSQGITRDGRYALRYGLPGDPVSSEASALAALLEQIQETGTPVHLMQISTARGVELIQAAKAQGLPITASTTWMHLLLNTRDLQTYDTSLHLAPPLGNPEDQTALIEAVTTGILDGIAINHRAYTYEEKTVGFASAPPGAIGLELALALLWQQFSQADQALALVRALSTAPAQVLQQPAPTLQPGRPAEMVLFDPQQEWQVDGQQLHSPGRNTPWFGSQIKGRVLKVWTQGSRA